MHAQYLPTGVLDFGAIHALIHQRQGDFWIITKDDRHVLEFNSFCHFGPFIFLV